VKGEAGSVAGSAAAGSAAAARVAAAAREAAMVVKVVRAEVAWAAGSSP